VLSYSSALHIYKCVSVCVWGRERDLQMAEFQSQIMQSLISFYSNAAFTELIFRSLNLFFFLQKVWGLYLYFRWLCFYTIFHLSFFLGFYHCSAFRTPHLLFSIHVMLILETQRGEVMLAARAVLLFMLQNLLDRGKIQFQEYSDSFQK